MRVAGTIKAFDLSTASVGDVIPVGTLAYKKVVVKDATGANAYAILSGVVTKPGIVTTGGALRKNRVRGLLVTSIEKIAGFGDSKWNSKSANYSYNSCVITRFTTATSTGDGVLGQGYEHPAGLTYNVGEEVVTKQFNKTSKQCSKGIHVYLTRQGAENH